MTKILIIVGFIFCVGAFQNFTNEAVGSGITYYIAANGSDSNNGTTKTTPWLHAPGMTGCTGVCASTQPKAGDSYIFRGGDTWHFGNSSLAPFVEFKSGAWTWSWSGTAATCNLNASAGAIVTTGCIYIGVDNTWFSGSTWSRPKINMDNPLTTSSPASCSYDDSTDNIWTLGGSSNVIVDNFEFLGWCWNTTSQWAAVFSLGSNSELKNSYFHGWSMGQVATGCGSCDSDEYWMVGGQGGSSNYLRIDHNVFDGSDSTYGNTSNKATGGVFQTGGEIDHNVVIHASNGMKYDYAILIHDNYFNNMYEPVAGGTHGNIIEWAPADYTSSTYYFNNLTSVTNEGESVDMYPGAASSNKQAYIFNNISWGNGNPSNCYMIEGDETGGPGHVQFFNNTSDAPCDIRWLRGTAVSGSFQNNHFIGGTSLSSFNSNLAATDNGEELYQTEALANSLGYLMGNGYAPTSSKSVTVGAGGNLTALCNSMDNPVAAAACLNGYEGVTYDSVNHIAIGNKKVPRSPAWDVGAYQFSGSGAPLPTPVPAPNPPTNLRLVAQQ